MRPPLRPRRPARRRTTSRWPPALTVRCSGPLCDPGVIDDGASQSSRPPSSRGSAVRPRSSLNTKSASRDGGLIDRMPGFPRGKSTRTTTSSSPTREDEFENALPSGRSSSEIAGGLRHPRVPARNGSACCRARRFARLPQALCARRRSHTGHDYDRKMMYDTDMSLRT